jgi:hypothetical protein
MIRCSSPPQVRLSLSLDLYVLSYVTLLVCPVEGTHLRDSARGSRLIV